MCEIVLAGEQRNVVGWEGQGGSGESGRFLTLCKMIDKSYVSNLWWLPNFVLGYPGSARAVCAWGQS